MPKSLSKLKKLNSSLLIMGLNLDLKSNLGSMACIHQISMGPLHSTMVNQKLTLLPNKIFPEFIKEHTKASIDLMILNS